ncbi:hypothetical protein HanPI659440_Chr15g0604721 [Helianthus annuus]|nr:hypothetical protein HanPI659440_Chr15g0604721 [Helianthus annuus]
MKIHNTNGSVGQYSLLQDLNYFGFAKFCSPYLTSCFEVAVAMQNLEKLLKDTPTHELLLSGLNGGRQFYPTHYSEFIRLAWLLFINMVGSILILKL